MFDVYLSPVSSPNQFTSMVKVSPLIEWLFRIGSPSMDRTASQREAPIASTFFSSARTVAAVPAIPKQTRQTATKLFGENSTLGILAHETGHRWLARLMFRDANRSISDALLGRQRAHWSFFHDSDGSVMEGNEITDLGGGSFRTASTTEKYGRLDQYAMGLVTAAEVPRWFYVEAPITSFDRESPAVVGITFTGTRRDVLIEDVIAALGPRVPSAADSPRVHRQAFVFVRRPTAVLDARDLTRLTRIREEFGPFFSRATENRMTVRTTLTP